MAAPLGILQAEPLYFGQEHPTKGISADDFVRRMDAFAVANANLAGPVLAGTAAGFLRDEAADWFQHGLPATEPADHALALTGWQEFRRVFRQAFCSVTSSADLSATWNMKQSATERSDTFALKVCAAMHKYRELLPVEPQVAAADFAAINLARNDLANANNQGAVDAAAAALDQAVRALLLISNGRLADAILGDLARKLVADGVRSGKLREMVRKEERQGTQIGAIVRLLREAERNNTAVRAGDAAQPKPPPPNRSAAVKDGQDEPNTSAAQQQQQKQQNGNNNNSKRGRGRGRGGGRGGGQSRGGQGRGAAGVEEDGDPDSSAVNGSDSRRTSNRGRGGGSGSAPASRATSDGPPGPCPFCGEDDPPHWKAECPVRLRLRRETASGSSSSLHYGGVDSLASFQNEWMGDFRAARL